MVFVLALIAIGLGGGLAASSAVPRWVTWIVPLAVAGLGVYYIRRYEEGHQVRAVFIVIEIVTVIAIFAGYSYRERDRDGERLYRGD
jgi:hypothetical protein